MGPTRRPSVDRHLTGPASPTRGSGDIANCLPATAACQGPEEPADNTDDQRDLHELPDEADDKVQDDESHDDPDDAHGDHEGPVELPEARALCLDWLVRHTALPFPAATFPPWPMSP